MNETTVTNHVRNWLQKRWTRKINEDYYVDFLVSEMSKPNLLWQMNFECVECKGTKSNVHRAVGQAMDYYLVHGCIPTYLAVPEDYKQLDLLERITEQFSLPIGILLARNDGEITIRRKAYGKIRCKMYFTNEKGELTSRFLGQTPLSKQLYKELDNLMKGGNNGKRSVE